MVTIKVDVIEGTGDAIVQASKEVIQEIIKTADEKILQERAKCKDCKRAADCKNHATDVKAAAEKALEGITEFLAVMGEAETTDEESEGGK